MEKRGLGRGLSALIPERKYEGEEARGERREKYGIINIPIDKINTNKYQPREDFDQESLNELAASIKEKGVIQPILVREQEDEYELIAGERRFRAAKMLNLPELPAIVKQVTDLDSLEISLIENIQREDLNPMDQAKAYERLIDEFNMTHETIADTIGKDRTTITHMLRLLTLPQKIQEYVSRGTISIGHARTILGLTTESEQMRLCTKVIKNDLSVRDAERYAKRMTVGSKKKLQEKDPDLISLEEELSEAFGTKVKIIKGLRGGKVEIEFYSDSDLERVVSRLKSK